MEKLCCKVCGRSFPSPRSFGVHMRSHVLKSEDKLMCRYGLRENPRKSWRLMEKEKDMVYTKSCKHMKCHSEMGRDALSVGDEEEDEKDGKFEKKEKYLKSNRSYEEGEDEMQSQSDSEVTTVVFPARERRKGWRSSVSSPDYEDEEKVGAFCLMMLSRGAGSVLDSSDKISVATDEEAEKKRSNSGFQKFDFETNELKKVQSFPKYDFGINELKKLQSFPSESEFSPKLMKSEASPDKNVLNSAVSELGQRRRYKCKTCNKSFHSYQALGGHMASHKKIKESSFTEIPATEELNIQNRGSKSTKKCHECSICGKIFGSGQALGGHMRSHLVPANNASSADEDQASPAVIEVEQKSFGLGLIDLNLPVLDDEIYDNPNGNIEYWV